MVRKVWLVSAAVLGLCAGFAPAARAVGPTTPNYVALGDSYTAGPLIPNQVEPYGCLRSDHNYPHLLAPAVGLELRDVSCSGATTRHMTQTQGVSPGPNPPQFDALDAGTLIVTLGIGGNDIGFSGIAKDCVAVDPTTTPCQDKYVVNGVDEISRRIADTGPKVAAVLDEIHRRAPQARVFVVDYLPILPESGLGCWPLLPIAFNDVPYLRAKQKELNAMLAAQAAATTYAKHVDSYTPSIGHDSCQPPPLRWVEPLVPASPAAPVHPNLLGEMAYALIVQAAIEGRPPPSFGPLPTAGPLS
jgi:lysophospholipase L1-like esterase